MITRSTYLRLWMHKVAINFRLITRRCSTRFKMSSLNIGISFEKRFKSISEKVVSWEFTHQRPRMSTTNTSSNRRRQSARRWIQQAAQMVITLPEFQTSSYIKCFTPMISYPIRVKQLWKITIELSVDSKRYLYKTLKLIHQRIRQQFWRATTHPRMIWAIIWSKKVVESRTPHLVKIVRFWTVRIRKAFRSWTSFTPSTIKILWIIWHILRKSNS